MANIKSAKKRISVINRQRKENSFIKATISTYTKKFRALLESGDIENAEAKLKETIKLIDSAENKGVLHKNNASRKISRLSIALDKAKAEQPKEVKVEKVKEVKVEKPAEVEEKPAPKKRTAKKTVEKVDEEKPAKKTVAKKATTQTAAKKATTKTVAKKATTKKD